MVQRVPHVQRSRHIGRRDHDAVGLAGVSRRGVEISSFDPGSGPTGFNGFGIVSLVEAEAAHVSREKKTRGILTWVLGPLKATKGHSAARVVRWTGLFLERTQGLCYTNGSFHLLRGDAMATGRDKDRKTRKKHRKNVKRMKALAKARRGGKRGKKG